MMVNSLRNRLKAAPYETNNNLLYPKIDSVKLGKCGHAEA